MGQHFLRPHGQALQEQGLDGSGVNRSGEEKALAPLAPLGLQALQLPLIFYAFGQGLDAQGPTELHECVNQGHLFVRIAHGGHKRPVDLERIDRELPQVGE